MQYRSLGKTGLSLSTIGFGSSPLGNVFGDVELDECIRAVHCAIDRGINFFDVSPYYGITLAEERFGHALNVHMPPDLKSRIDEIAAPVKNTVL